MFGFSQNNIYMCGDHGALFHYNGSIWSSINTGMTDIGFLSMYGVSSNDLYIVGYEENSPNTGKLIHYNGSTFTVLKDLEIYGGCISSLDNNIFYIISGASVYSYNKTTDALDNISSVEYGTMFGLSSGNMLFAGGSSGDISQFDGTSWQNVGNQAYITASFSANDLANVFFVGWYGVIYHLDMTTGLNDQLTTASSFNVYPNPAQGDVTLDFNVNLQKDASVELYNSLGQKIVIVIELDVVHLSVADLPRGLYYIRVSIGENSETKKILLN
jgi:hypothetical protein